MKLTTCGNCENVYEDMNPGDDSIDYPDSLIERFKIQELPTINLLDDKGNKEDIGYGCLICNTDGYLQDNVNPYCGGMAKKIHSYLKKNGQ